VLYFVRGWTLQRIAERYGVTQKRVGQMVRGWADLAMSQGYVARIPSEEECGLV
jgi:DNA-binding transcriptional regulator LsrR (DeoR family)